MRVPRRVIAELIADLLDKLPKEALAKQVAAYILSENRSQEVYSLMRDVMAIRAERGFVEVEAVSAHELSNELSRQINQIVKNIRPGTKRVILNEQLDSDLIGGVSLNVIDKQLDLSLKAKINQFRQLTSQGGV